MQTSRLLLITLVLGLAACASQNPAGQAGRNLKLKAEGVTAQFQAPDGWKVVDAKNEPIDWDYAANAPRDEREFGVILQKDDPKATTAGRYQSYLANVHAHYDPKVRMTPDAPFTLKDGRTITPYRFSSAYWKQRLVIIIPEGNAATTFEFTAPTLESLKASHELIQKMLSTYQRTK
jgi:hypothetical protein